MYNNQILAEVAHLPPEYFSTLHSFEPNYFRVGVLGLVLGEQEKHYLKTSTVVMAIYNMLLSGCQFRAYIDVIGRLAGFISYQEVDESDIELKLFRSYYGAALSMSSSLIHDLGKPVKKIIYKRHHCSELETKTRLTATLKTVDPTRILEYWKRGEGITCALAAKNMIHQISLLGFALQLSLSSASFSSLPFTSLLRLLSHPATLDQLQVVRDSFGNPQGLMAWAFVGESAANIQPSDWEKFNDISEWRCGSLKVPIWQL